MKHHSFTAIVLLALLGALAVPSVQAADSAREKKVSKRDLAKYDADKDGKLSPEEDAVRVADKEKAKAQRKQKQKQPVAEAAPAPAEPAPEPAAPAPSETPAETAPSK